MPSGQGDVNFYECSRRVFDERLCPHVNNALVFLDASSAEVIHWHGGAVALFDSGALDVREFSAFESGDSSQQKAVFFVSSPLSSLLDTVRDIIHASCFHEVVVFTAVCSSMHSVIEYGPTNVTEDDARAFTLYRSQIQGWMWEGNKDSRASVKLVALPLVMAPVHSSFFVLPNFSNLFPLLPTDIDHVLHRKGTEKAAGNSGLFDIDFACLPRHLQLRLKLLACALDSVFEALDCADDIFALGSTSNIVASELASLAWAKARRKVAQRKASVLLVDRTLDVASVVGHFHDTLLDKMTSVLPRLPGHHVDVMVDMTPAVGTVTSNPEFRLVAPGCLSHPGDPVATSLLHVLAMLKQKEALTEINRHISAAAAKEAGDGLSLDARSSRTVTAHLLESHMNHFRGKSVSIRRHCGLLQMVQATIRLLRHPAVNNLDSLLAEEKGLLQGLGEEDAGLSAFGQISKALDRQLKLPAAERTRSVDDILLLLTFVCSLVDNAQDISSDDLELMKTLLFQAAVGSESADGDIIKQLVQGDCSDVKCAKVIHDVVDKLHGLCRARDGLATYRSIYEPGSLSSQARLKPLLKQLTDDIVDANRPELGDVVHKSSGFGDLIKSGFGLFRAVSKARPGDQPLLIIFVIGGVTSTEVRQVRDVVSAAKTKLQVVIGSTSLVSPRDVLGQILLQDNLHPNQMT